MNETNQTDRFAPLFAELDRRLAGEVPVRLAIEGGSASGKTTLGKILAERYDCTVFHMDDFFSALSSAPPRGLPSPAGMWIGNGFSPRCCSRSGAAKRFLPAVRLRFHAAAKCRGDRAEKARRCRGGILHAPRPCAVLRSFCISGHLPGIAARAHFPPQHAGESKTLFCRMDPDGASVFRRVRYSGKVHAAPSHTVKKEEAPAISSSSTAPPERTGQALCRRSSSTNRA